MTSKVKKFQGRRGEDVTFSTRKNQASGYGRQGPQDQEMPTLCLGQGVNRSEACPSMPVPSWLQVCLWQNHADSLTFVVAVCVAGIDKLLQAVRLPGNLQEQGDGVILPIVQVEHGFQQTGLPRLRVCKTKWGSEKGAAQEHPGNPALCRATFELAVHEVLLALLQEEQQALQLLAVILSDGFEDLPAVIEFETLLRADKDRVLE